MAGTIPPMNCLVTGCAGFIGSALSERLLSVGCDVLGIDNFSDYYPREFKLANLDRVILNPRFQFIEGDLLDLDLHRLLTGVDWVFHEAGRPGVRMSWGTSFDAYTRDNVLATQTLLDAAAESGIRRLVYASSSSVYGDCPELPFREASPTQPISPYGVTKLAGEHLCRLYFVSYGVPVVSLRYFTVYGPGQRPDMAFHCFIRAAIEGRDLVVYGDGDQTRDFTCVSDVLDANLSAAETPGIEGRVFNIGGGSRVGLNEVVRLIGELVGRPLIVRHVEDQKGDVRHTLSDITAARQALGYSPKVSIHDGLAGQVDWMLARSPALKAA